MSQAGAASPAGLGDDVVAAFQIDGQPVRGRMVRLGAVIDDILSAHDYPEPVGRLLGEAVMLAALVGASLKFDGRLLVQARGEGPVSLLAADYETPGRIRGYARIDAEATAALGTGADARALLGDGALAMTIDQGPDFNTYQSLVPLDAGTIAEAAAAYFDSSEQVPTRVHLAVGQVQTGAERPVWRAGGAIIQKVAADDARGDTEEAWNTASTLFDTLTDLELLDPALTMDRVLYRLFHEEGVRRADRVALTKRCTCSTEHIAGVLASFPETEIDGLAEDDGRLKVTCEYCNKDFFLERADVAAARS